MVVGTPGGTTIPTSVYQTIVDIVDFGMSAKDAVNKPKFHHQWLPDELVVEKGFPEDVMKELEKLGYKVSVYTIAGYATNIGRVELIKVTNGKLDAVADSRGDDSVAGY
jgi:gamma-glutamyltranspeptidase/glutathione hydrolase